MFKNKLSTLFLAFLFTGCASHHVVPDLDYTAQVEKLSTPELQQFIVAFDQNGHIYPSSPQDKILLQPTFDWVAEEKAAYKSTGNAFELKNTYPKVEYNSWTQKKITERMAAKLSTALEGGKKLFIYTHGFSNNYAQGRENIQKLVDSTASEGDVVLRVIWDGLIGNPTKSHWKKALTYSNLAGQVGLRQVLQALDQPVDVVFITHSRGAAVAMSTVFDPLYDKKIKRDTVESLTASHVKSISMLMLAPAIGNGHLAMVSSKLEIQQFQSIS